MHHPRVTATDHAAQRDRVAASIGAVHRPDVYPRRPFHVHIRAEGSAERIRITAPTVDVALGVAAARCVTLGIDFYALEATPMA